jgi:hypothetical protein
VQSFHGRCVRWIAQVKNRLVPVAGITVCHHVVTQKQKKAAKSAAIKIAPMSLRHLHSHVNQDGLLVGCETFMLVM